MLDSGSALCTWGSDSWQDTTGSVTSQVSFLYCNVPSPSFPAAGRTCHCGCKPPRSQLPPHLQQVVAAPPDGVQGRARLARRLQRAHGRRLACVSIHQQACKQQPSDNQKCRDCGRQCATTSASPHSDAVLASKPLQKVMRPQTSSVVVKAMGVVALMLPAGQRKEQGREVAIWALRAEANRRHAAVHCSRAWQLPGP